MIRSKARWCEQGERSTRYFFDLEKRNRSNNYITKLKADDRTLVTPTEILKEKHRYYQNLYTSTCTNPNDACFDKFIESPSLSKLTAQLADTSDGRLTKEEWHASLKDISRGKSPGTEGLTAEFYLNFGRTGISRQFQLRLRDRRAFDFAKKRNDRTYSKNR